MSFTSYRVIPLPLALSTVIALSTLPACGDSDSSGSAADAMVNSSTDGAVQGAVPVTANELFAFLQAGSYEGFDAEPAVHPSSGPHGQVRSFFNAALSSSLMTGQTSHPVGSATVKELHSGDALSGWAVMVKTGNGSTADDWYFYEVFSTTDGSNPVADANGLPGCAGCHSSGQDYILTSFP